VEGSARAHDMYIEVTDGIQILEYRSTNAEASILGLGGRDPQILGWGRGVSKQYYYVL